MGDCRFQLFAIIVSDRSKREISKRLEQNVPSRINQALSLQRNNAQRKRERERERERELCVLRI